MQWANNAQCSLLYFLPLEDHDKIFRQNKWCKAEKPNRRFLASFFRGKGLFGKFHRVTFYTNVTLPLFHRGPFWLVVFRSKLRLIGLTREMTARKRGFLRSINIAFVLLWLSFMSYFLDDKKYSLNNRDSSSFWAETKKLEYRNELPQKTKSAHYSERLLFSRPILKMIIQIFLLFV